MKVIPCYTLDVMSMRLKLVHAECYLKTLHMMAVSLRQLLLTDILLPTGGTTV